MFRATILVLFAAFGICTAMIDPATGFTPSPCPPGVPLFNCLISPCSTSKCPAAPAGSTCTDNYCGGCNAIWTGPDGVVIKNCKTCTYNGQTYANGQTWLEPTPAPCKQCTCIDDTKTCRTPRCVRPACRNPISLTTQCCPVCPKCCDPLLEPGKFGNPLPREGYACCPSTGKWVTSIGDGVTFPACTGMEIRPNGVACPLAVTIPPTTCPDGVPLVDCLIRPCSLACPAASSDAKCVDDYCGGCNAIWTEPDGTVIEDCHRCVYNGVSYAIGQTWTENDPKTGCQVCTCTKEGKSCAVPRCPELKCRNPITVPGSCCPVCPKCCDPYKEPGKFGNPRPREGYACCPITGQWVTSIGDGATFPACVGMETKPNGVRCPQVCDYDTEPIPCDVSPCAISKCQVRGATCTDDMCHCRALWYSPTGALINQCGGCWYAGTQYAEGDTWNEINPGPCRTCTCFNGQKQCYTPECARPQCDNGVIIPSLSCCPQCLKCCDPLTEPGRFCNPPYIEGHQCCPTTGAWVASIGDAWTFNCDGLEHGPFGVRCPLNVLPPACDNDPLPTR